MHFLPNGTSLNPDVLRRDVLYPVLDRLGISRSSRAAGFHTFRHSAASIVNQQTGNLKLVQRLLGHSNLSTTADVYTHTSTEAEREAALALEQAIYGDLFSTKADDGDPVDVLVLMDEPAFAGCVLSCRPIGVIEGEQGDKKDKERNDRIIAVEKDAHSWADIKTISDLGKEFCRELEEFFVNYHKLSGQQYRVLGLKGPDQARKLVKSGMR